MNKSIRLICLVTLFISVTVISGCGCSRYRIQLKDGREYAADSRPEFQEKTGYYRYRNTHGKDALLRADEVLIVERM